MYYIVYLSKQYDFLYFVLTDIYNKYVFHYLDEENERKQMF